MGQFNAKMLPLALFVVNQPPEEHEPNEIDFNEEESDASDGSDESDGYETEEVDDDNEPPDDAHGHGPSVYICELCLTDDCDFMSLSGQYVSAHIDSQHPGLQVKVIKVIDIPVA